MSDIVSPITDKPLPLKILPAAALKAGRAGYDKPTPQNTVFLFIDHQIGLMAGVRDFTSLAEYKSDVVALGKIAKALNVAVLISSSNAQWQNGDTLPELKQIFPEQPIIRRTGIINAYEDPTFRMALEDVVARTGRRHLVISGVTLGTCVAMPTYSLLNDGYAVYPVVDASGAWSRYEAEAAMARMTRAGANLVSVFAFGCELQADWKEPNGNAMFEPFTNNLPEYGFVAQAFWNNANQRAVPDPFGVVK
jgi:nicotinamidase-related amidase